MSDACSSTSSTSSRRARTERCLSATERSRNNFGAAVCTRYKTPGDQKLPTSTPPHFRSDPRWDAEAVVDGGPHFIVQRIGLRAQGRAVE
jgi:hypothetical protein